MQIQLSDLISQAGNYAFAEIDKKVAELRAAGQRIIDFGVGDPSSPAPVFIINQMTQLAQNHNTSGYPSYVGNARFLQSCALYMNNRFGVELDPATEITSTIGSKEAVFHFPLGIINAGDIVICPTPGYPPYKNGTRFAGGIPYFVPLLEENDFLIDFELIPQEIADKARIIWINYPNSPTGKVADKEYLTRFIKWAHSNNIIIAADEGCYIDIYYDDPPPSILEIETEGIITFYSLSKRNNMTGYRIGFCAGDKRLIKALQQVKTNIDSGTPDFIQDAAILALNDNEHANQMRDEYSKKRQIMLDALCLAGFPECINEATFYIWQKAPKGITGVNLTNKLVEFGIVATPGEWISDETDQGINPGVNYVRFALVPPLEDVRWAVNQLQTYSHFN